MKTCFSICFMLFGYLCCAQSIPSAAFWQLEWSDEFNGTTINDEYWRVPDHEDGAKGTEADSAELTGTNHYVQLNRPENIEVANGMLRLTLIHEVNDYHCPVEFHDEWHCKKEWETGEGYKFTSAGVETRIKNFKYGYIEARMKIPWAWASWPAFWTFRDGFANANACEIDVFEMNTIAGSTTMPTNLHTGYCNGNPIGDTAKKECPQGGWECDLRPCYGKDVSIPSFADTWRIYGLEWSPAFIRWYVDGVLVRQVNNKPSTWDDGFNDACEIRIGTGVHDDQVQKAIQVHSDHFPADMYVDYVRYYVPKFSCAFEVDACTYDLSTLTTTVKERIELGGISCTNTVAVNTHVKMMAPWVLLDGTFHVPLGAELSVFGHPCYTTSDISSDSSPLSAKMNNNQQLELANGDKYELWPGNTGNIDNWGIYQPIYIYPANNSNTGEYDVLLYHTGYWSANNVIAKKIN